MSISTQKMLASVFRTETGALPTRIRWKAVKLKRVIPDSPKFSKAYRVTVNGKTVGGVGLIRSEYRVHPLKTWGWVEVGQSFDSIQYHEHSRGKRWAIADMLYTLSRPLFQWHETKDTVK